MTGRRYLTKRETLELFDKQDGRCAKCREDLKPGKFIREHTIPNAFRPGKPDALWCMGCAKEKTRKDVWMIAKAKRQAGETGQQARRRAGKTKPIPNRGFPSPEYRRRIKAKYEDKRT